MAKPAAAPTANAKEYALIIELINMRDDAFAVTGRSWEGVPPFGTNTTVNTATALNHMVDSGYELFQFTSNVDNGFSVSRYVFRKKHVP